ncbi:OmpP1/FadL family transporter [Marinobacter halophilus]|uniref:Aromatic hydrocarbon degradation protein n=1 Tax=Marinobacter halophilus TaxID=1323740 RepID=A0A2T1KJW5_9GAMM|nr:outer membrane protein transport protein [Marinobacter halophilus]PSF10365.1 aromatic hydrocarbon degradation protein [Marinobacter halophilus]GGC70108.1 aromatic hydrocarbon degradation protein [Marinobacter halophilus]
MHKNTNTLVKAIRLATLAAMVAPVNVMAGGFSLNEQSASQMGVANAGATANPENATTVLFNPAGMSQLSGTNISFGAAVLDITAEAKTSSIQATGAIGQAVDGGDYRSGGDIADPAVLPNFYMTHEVNDSIDVGFGIHAPYGLAADYENDFAGRFFADKTELTAIALTPSIAINNGEGLSMGLGLNIIYAEGRLSRYQDLSGAVLQATGDQNLALKAPEPYADVEGDDIGVTFRVGFLYELSDRTQFGLSAQTGTELNLKGDMEVSGLPANLGLPASADERVEVPLAIPESITFGVRHKLMDEITLLAGAAYARWSRFEELDIVSREGGSGSVSQILGGLSPTQTPPDPINHVTEEWKNTWQFNVGGIWQATPAWAFKAGYAFDESPVDEYVTARIPSTDRHWLTLGAQWKDVASGWTVDAAVGTLIFDSNAKVNDREYSHDDPTGDPVSLSSYQAEYDLSAWSAAIEFSKAF